MAEYITDPELLQQLEAEEYVSDPELLAALESPDTATEVMERPKSFWEDFTAPNQPEPFDLATSAKRVGTSTALGAGLGMVLPGPGTVVGGAAGLASGVAGEFARNMGASDATRTGVELVAGEVPALVPIGAKLAAKAISPVSYRGGRALSIFDSDRNLDNALKTTRMKLFGKPSIDLDVQPTNALETQVKLRTELFGENAFAIPEEKKVSSIFRESLYSDLKANQMGKAGGKPDVFITSPEYQDLTKQLGYLAERDRITPEELKSLKKILAEDLSQNQAVKDVASQDIINLIQNGGVYQVAKKGAEAETKTKIPEDARLLLREYFNNYLERTVGSQKYNKLKEIERAEFIAEARDFIPVILENNFRVGRDEYAGVLSSIKGSPEGKKEFVSALMQHFSKPDFTTSKKLIAEFARLRPALIESGVLKSADARVISGKLRAFDKDVGNKKLLNNALSIIGTPLMATLAAEGSGTMFSSKDFAL